MKIGERNITMSRGWVVQFKDGAVICEDDMPWIKVPNKRPRFKTFSFSPDKDSGRVLVNKLHKEYKWVAELRPEKAQTIAQKVLTNASRIGLDEFELLRRKGSQL